MKKQAPLRLASPLLAILLALPLASVRAAESLSTQELAAQADTIALVTVIQASSLVNRSMSTTGLLSVEAFTYQFEIERVWKGGAATPGVLTVSVQQCARPLQRGERYLIFGGQVQAAAPVGRSRVDALAQPVAGNVAENVADEAAPGWQIRGCEYAIPASEAQEHVAQLNQLYLSPVAQHRP